MSWLGECQVGEFDADAPHLYNFGRCFAPASRIFHVCDPELGKQAPLRLCPVHLIWMQRTRCIVVELTMCPQCHGYGHDPCEHCGFAKQHVATTEDEMKLSHAPHKDLHLEDEGFFDNARKYVDKREIRELADSIEADGLKVPLGVFVHNGKKIVSSGSRRYRAIALLIKEGRANGLRDKVPYVAVKVKNSVDARVEGLIDNIQRKDLTSYEIATQLHALREAGLKQADIATRIKKSQSYVSRLLKCFEACAPTVHKAWEQNKLPDDDVQTLSKLPRPEQEKRIVKLLEHRDVAAKAKPGQVRAAKAAARQAAKGGAKASTAAPPPQKSVRPGASNLESFSELTGRAPKNNKYVRGMHDAFRYMLGELGPGEFGPDFSKWAAKQAKTDKPALTSGKRPSTKKGARK